MFGFIIKLKSEQLRNQPIKLIGYVFVLLFIFFNIYAIKFLSDKPSFPGININLYISILPIIIVLFSSFIPQYKFNVLLLSTLYPISDIKNASLVLFNELFSYTYVIALVIIFELYFVFEFNLLAVIQIAILVVSVAVLKFFIHYFIWDINIRSLSLFVGSSTIIAVQLYIFVVHIHFWVHVPLIIFLLTIYFTQFKRFRYDYYSLSRFHKKVNTINQFYFIIFYGFNEYKNLFFLYFIVKIGFVLLFSIYYHIYGEIFISPIALMTVLSPLFLFTYFHNNFFILNYRINKNLFFTYSNSRIIIINLSIVFITSLIDLVFTIPTFIVFGLNYLISYLILFLSFVLSSFFISLYFPKEKKTSNLWFKGTTSTIGTFLFFFYISFVTNPIFNIGIKIIPIIISIVVFSIAVINFNKKQVSIFEDFKY